MTTKADYTAEEWDLLCAGPLLAGMGVSLLHPSLLAGVRETHAMVRAVHEAKKTYDDNVLVLAVVAELEARHEKMPLAAATSEAVLTDLVKIDAILDAKGKVNEAQAEEGNDYRNFLYTVADKVAHAAGGFLGLGEKVNEDEAFYLKKLKELLFRE